MNKFVGQMRLLKIEQRKSISQHLNGLSVLYCNVFFIKDTNIFLTVLDRNL